MSNFALIACLLALVCVHPTSLKSLGENDNTHVHIRIDESTGDISVELSDGSVRNFEKAPFRQLGKQQDLEFDPDTFTGQNGNEVVVLEFGRDENGNPKKDFDGIIHLDGVAYDVVVEGEITEADGKAEYDATLKEINHPERQAKGPQVNDVLSDVSPGAGNSVTSDMDKRQSPPDYDQLWLELALYVDQAIWEIFLNENDGDETEAMKKINGFMQGVMTIVNADYATFEIPIEVVVTEYEVWKTQPSEFEAAKNASNAGDYYIEAAKSTKYAPDRLPSDHTAILSAYPMPGKHGVTNALATICNDPNQAISATAYSGKNFELAEVLAHEIGHSLAAAHDAQERKPENECVARGFIMAGEGALGASSAITWSDCTKDRVEIERKNWDANNNNCLLNKPEGESALPTSGSAPTPDPSATTTPRPAGGGRDCQDNWDTCATVTQFCAVGGIKRNCKATCGLC